MRQFRRLCCLKCDLIQDREYFAGTQATTLGTDLGAPALVRSGSFAGPCSVDAACLAAHCYGLPVMIVNLCFDNHAERGALFGCDNAWEQAWEVALHPPFLLDGTGRCFLFGTMVFRPSCVMSHCFKYKARQQRTMCVAPPRCLPAGSPM